MDLRRIVLGLSLILGLAISQSVAAQEPSPIVGTWKILTFTAIYVDTNRETNILGDHPTGFLVYTSGGHVVVWLAGGDRNIPGAPTFTDAEGTELFKTIIAAYAGTYSVEGDKVIHHIESAWIPAWNGTDQARFIERNGNRLKITTPLYPAGTFAGGSAKFVLTFEKVE